MRASIAAFLAALSVVLVVSCLRGPLPRLAVVAPITLSFVGACVAVLGATDEDTAVGRRRVAIGAVVANTLLVLIGCGLLLHALAS